MSPSAAVHAAPLGLGDGLALVGDGLGLAVVGEGLGLVGDGDGDGLAPAFPGQDTGCCDGHGNGEAALTWVSWWLLLMQP